jgi:hypothetical protein
MNLKKGRARGLDKTLPPKPKPTMCCSACWVLRAHEVDLRKVEAVFKGGVLSLKLPLKKPVKTVKNALK